MVRQPSCKQVASKEAIILPGSESRSLVLLAPTFFHSLQHSSFLEKPLGLSLHRGCKDGFCSVRKECGEEGEQTYCCKIIPVFLQPAGESCVCCLRVLNFFPSMQEQAMNVNEVVTSPFPLLLINNQ